MILFLAVIRLCIRNGFSTVVGLRRCSRSQSSFCRLTRTLFKAGNTFKGLHHGFIDMSRISVGLNIVLAAAVLILGGLVYQHRNGPAPTEPDSRGFLTSSPMESRVGAAQDVSNAAIIDRLVALDARLAAMERRPLAYQANSSDRSNTKPSISPQDIELANRRLSSMFPASTYDRREMLRFQTEVAKLPANEQVALLSAYTRAINDDRLKPRM